MMLFHVPGHPGVFDAWLADEPHSPVARLARGAYGVSEAWDARGSGYGENVSDDAWDAFHEGLRVAEDDLLRAARDGARRRGCRGRTS